ncbi:MAG: hypothetical protein KUG77_09280 [Nannocystaceae bacterium]|nr:hypothetical protein [Nannocystaceae bacterium]
MIAGLALSGCFADPLADIDIDVGDDEMATSTTGFDSNDSSATTSAEPKQTSGVGGTTTEPDPSTTTGRESSTGSSGDEDSSGSTSTGSDSRGIEGESSTGGPLDCDGVPDGAAALDECGVCDGPGGPCWGCTMPSASNYDPLATLNDGTCVCDPGPGAIADQSNLSSSAGSGGQDQWQSFTVGVSGGLVRLDLGVSSPVSGPSAGTLRFYEGEGTAGIELGSQDVTFEDVFNTIQEFELDEPIPMTQGEVYTVRFSVPAVTVGWVDVADDVYPGGRASYSVGQDFVFRTTMTQCVPG